jgi:hypothetical protein
MPRRAGQPRAIADDRVSAMQVATKDDELIDRIAAILPLPASGERF